MLLGVLFTLSLPASPNPSTHLRPKNWQCAYKFVTVQASASGPFVLDISSSTGCRLCISCHVSRQSYSNHSFPLGNANRPGLGSIRCKMTGNEEMLFCVHTRAPRDNDSFSLHSSCLSKPRLMLTDHRVSIFHLTSSPLHKLDVIAHPKKGQPCQAHGAHSISEARCVWPADR